MPQTQTNPAAAAPAARFQPTVIPGLRSPYARAGGIVHFPRMLDKIRLHAAGRLPPPWVEAMGSPRGFDGTCCRFLGIEYAALRQHVLANPDARDESVLEWAFQHGRRPGPAEIEVWSDSLMKRGWRDKFAERVRFRLAEVGLPANAAETMFDFIELDEGRVPPTALPTE